MRTELPTAGHEGMPGRASYGLYLSSLLACVVANKVIGQSRKFGWLPEWAHAMIAVQALAPAIMVAAGIALAKRRHR